MKQRKDFGKIKKDLTGKVFSMLTVVEFHSWVIQGKNSRVTFWTCQCKCGNKVNVKGTHLTRGDTKSCGCYKPGMLEFGESSVNTLMVGYKRHAKDRNYDWSLSREEFKKITSMNCYYCNKSPSQKIKNQRSNGYYIYNGIDRLDNDKGYTSQNVVACCRLCNWMKKDLELTYFKTHLRNICQNLNLLD